MSYREIPKDKILKFPATPGFKGWRDHFTQDSITHPAKMNLNLLRWILRTYTKPGDTVLDPMAGTGSTIIIASLLGRHGIAVEYEPKFCEMINENIKRTERHTTFTPKGKMICIQGDARELSKLLKEPDVVITSPPYSGRAEHRLGYDYQKRDKERGHKAYKGHRESYSADPNNISNLPHGDIETIITSPPYSEGIGHDPGDKASEKYKERLEMQKKYTRQMVSEGNIAKLKHGDIDAIITSPPYGEAQSGGGIATKGYDGPKHTPTDLVGERSYMPDKFEGEENISRLKYGEVDVVVSSPPYEETISGEGGGSLDQEESQSLKTMRKYSEDADNIGNLKSESYLAAMLQVYSECYKVLKSKGVIVLVTKNFIREKKVVRLDEDTIKLCEAAGFRLSDRWYFKLPTRSFWRILYKRRFPNVPEVKHEDVLIFTK